MKKRRLHIKRVLLLLATALPAARAPAAAAPPADLPALCREADVRFHAASNRVQFAAAARLYERIARRCPSGPAWYNAGSARFLAGDIGRALLDYRRAETFIPADPDLRHNLRVVLDARRDLFTPAADRLPAFLRPLVRLHRAPAWIRRRILLFSWTATWLLLFLLVRRRGRIPFARTLLIAAAAVSLLLIVSLALDLLRDRRTPPGVILAEEVTARQGDGLLYRPAFDQPLHAGTEFCLLERRGDWWRIRLPNDRSCWIPARSAALIPPNRPES